MPVHVLLSSGIAAAVLAGLHWTGRYLHVLDTVPRSRWLSAAAGVSVSYVFVQLLPEVAGAQESIERATSGVAPWLERHTWLLALSGVVVFYGLQAHAVRHRRRRRGGTTPDEVGVIHIASYAAYSGLIGYVLTEEAAHGTLRLVLFTIAIGLHFIVNDHGLRADHGRVYTEGGRVALTVAIIIGWLLGVVAPLSELTVTIPLSFLAGSIVLNVMKEELPSERESRFWPFATAAAGYAVLLIAI
jgi:hypothetical protein